MTDRKVVTMIVGCPTRNRPWIAEAWVNHVAWATVEAGVTDSEVTLMFVSHPDDPTNEILEKSAALFGMRTVFISDEEKPTDIKRHWTADRIHTMVRVRNLLLQGVREEAPSLFLSLDSDILINSKAIREMCKLLHLHKHGREPSASSHCVYLHPTSKAHPNYANLSSRGQLRRQEHQGQLMPVDVIMAAKLMTPAAYAIDYEFDKRGEDIGWSNSVREHGMSLAWSGNVTSKHCMERSHLDSVDKRCGY